MSSADVVVVGAGLSGLTAAIGLAEAGASVEVVARGHAATHWTAGGLDVAAPSGASTPADGIQALREDRLHPYAVIGDDVPGSVERFRSIVQVHGLPFEGDLSSPIRRVPTSIGGTRPVAILPTAQASALRPWAPDERLVICGFAGFKDFWSDHIAASLTRASVWSPTAARDGAPGDGARPSRVESVTVELPSLAGRHNLSALTIARLFDDPVSRRDAVDAIATVLGRIGPRRGRVGLPAAIGLDEHGEAFRELATALPLEPFEIPLVPPSIPGLRLFNTLRGALRAAGGRITIGEAVSEVSRSGGRVTAVSTTAAARQRTIRTGAMVLATGGIAGGGLVASAEALVEPVLGLPVEAPPSTDWLAPTPFEPDGHPLERAGVRADAALRPLGRGDDVALENVVVVGSMLAGQRYLAERCGDGVAITSGFRAASTLATGTQAALVGGAR
jgi:glycerol-3-phosphate dehydrogenase subunit B